MQKFPQDEVIKILFDAIKDRRIAKSWLNRINPIVDLHSECKSLKATRVWQEIGKTYLVSNPIIRDSLQTLLNHFAMSSNSNWQEVPILMRRWARRGWHINRWLPTFLLIDGPLGRLFRDSKSPISICLKESPKDFPLLTSARDAFNSEIFRNIRNGFAHWSFYWEDESDSTITIIHWETNREVEKISVLEGEVLHFISYSVIEAVDKHIFQ